MKTGKNLIIILAAAAILITAWVYYLSQVNQAREITQQSSSDKTEEIESDLEETDFDELDREILDIEAELNSTTDAETK